MRTRIVAIGYLVLLPMSAGCGSQSGGSAHEGIISRLPCWQEGSSHSTTLSSGEVYATPRDAFDAHISDGVAFEGTFIGEMTDDEVALGWTNGEGRPIGLVGIARTSNGWHVVWEERCELFVDLGAGTTPSYVAPSG